MSMRVKPTQNMMRVFLTAAMLLVQVAVFVMLIFIFSEWSPVLHSFNIILSIIVAIYLVNSSTQVNYKFSWIFLISILPVFGGIFFLVFGLHSKSRGMTKMLRDIHESSDRAFKETNDSDRAIPANQHASAQANFLEETTGYPTYLNTASHYCATGEEQFDVMLESIRQAQRFVFLEYFIISEGEMWTALFELLKIKVQEGVEVKLLYDDLGAVRFLPYQFRERLGEVGIEVIAYNPFHPLLSLRFNNRDHRKMIIVDGYIAMTGGINIADEYINRKERFGHWKDTGIVLAGPAVWSFTVMFLAVWNVLSPNPVDIHAYAAHRWAVDHSRLSDSNGGKILKNLFDSSTEGHILPFDDSPFDDEHQAAAAYRNIINRATESIDICTPYLVLDDEMSNALTSASQSGVHVRIITPHVPDKPYVHATTRSYYQQFVEKGVEIYEYTPGFIHAKSIVADNDTAIIGTVNFDYRSLYLHMENAVWLYGTASIAEMKADFERTIERSERITLEKIKNTHWVVKIVRLVLRVFAPLM